MCVSLHVGLLRSPPCKSRARSRSLQCFDDFVDYFLFPDTRHKCLCGDHWDIEPVLVERCRRDDKVVTPTFGFTGRLSDFCFRESPDIDTPFGEFFFEFFADDCRGCNGGPTDQEEVFRFTHD